MSRRSGRCTAGSRSAAASSPAGKPVTMQDIARECGVSKSTVSLVLARNPHCYASEQTQRRIIRAARSLGYVSAQLLREPQRLYNTRFVGMVIRTLSGNLLARRQEQRAIDIPAVHGYRPVIRSLARAPRGGGLDATRELVDAMRFLHSLRPKGLLYAGRLGGDALAAELADARGRLPMVSLDAKLEGCDCVEVDRALGAKKAVEYLLKLGHERIAFIWSSRPTGGGGGKAERPSVFRTMDDVENSLALYDMLALRLSGVMEAFRSAGLSAEPESFIHCRAETAFAAGEIAVDEILRRLGRRSHPTAIFAFDDELAIAALWAISERGLCVPRDISLMGFHDYPEAADVKPALTTVRLDAATIPATAARYLIERMHGKAPQAPRCTRISPKVIVRQSTAPPRAKRRP